MHGVPAAGHEQPEIPSAKREQLRDVFAGHQDEGQEAERTGAHTLRHMQAEVGITRGSDGRRIESGLSFAGYPSLRIGKIGADDAGLA